MHERPEDQKAELQALIDQWQHATDPESRWILRLLREKIACIEIRESLGRRPEGARGPRSDQDP